LELQLAAERGVADAQFDLGYCYAHRKGVEKDEAKAGQLYARSAKQGNADAQYNLGMC
jgi:TPR repeat protein